MLEPSFEEQELLVGNFDRDSAPLGRSERITGLLDTVGFAAVVAVLLVVRPPGTFALEPAVISAVLVTVATRVRLDTPFGFTVPVQLGFVPLLFSVPLSLVPIVVAGALAAARLPEILSGAVPLSRLAQTAGNSWFAVGPVAVFVVAGVEPHRAGAALLLLALLAQFAVDFGTSSVRFALTREANFVSQLRETWVYGVDAALTGIALVVAEQVQAHPAVPLSLMPILGLIALFAHERHHRLESLLELNNAYRGTALVLGDVVEADDGYTGQHSKGVVGLALEVGAALRLTPERRRNLEFAALLHDVGKIAIPKEIVNKPGKLDPEEWTIIKTHTVEGQRMLERVGGFMREVGIIVRSHHERWDGAGYPDGLSGEAIPLEARIVTCCDSWNAMRTDRSYRKALSHELALAELRANRGTQFDPDVVDALLALVDAPRPGAPHASPLEGALEQPLPEIGSSQAPAAEQQVRPSAIGALRNDD